MCTQLVQVTTIHTIVSLHWTGFQYYGNLGTTQLEKTNQTNIIAAIYKNSTK